MVAMRDSSGTALAVGRFAGLEPLGFEAGDNNWYRFVANGPTGATDPAGLSPHTGAHILRLLAAGNVRDALELLAILGVKGVHLVPNFLQRFHAAEKLSDGRCAQLAAKTVDVFKKVGESPQVLRIIDSCGTKFWWYKGQQVTIHGYHQVVLNGGKVYDLIAGVNGMEKTEYLKHIAAEMRIQPILQVVK
jgi:hypothetical protein